MCVGNEVPIPGALKRAFLRQIAEGAKATAATLRESLIAAQSAVMGASFRQGKILVSTSGSGQSGSFEISVTGKSWTPENVAALTEQLISVLDDCVSAGVATDAADEASINTLVRQMGFDDRLRGLRAQHGDFTSIR